MKTIRPDATQPEIDAYLEDWRPVCEFVKRLGYQVYAFDPDLAVRDSNDATFYIPRAFVERVMERVNAAAERGGEKKETP